MKNFIVHIISPLCFLLLWSCSGSSDSPDDLTNPQQETTTLQLSISLLDIPLSNRSTKSYDKESDFTYFEPANIDTEKIKTLRVFIVNENGIVEHNRFLNYDNPVTQPSMTFKVKSRATKKIYLFANELSKEDWEENGYYPFHDILPNQKFPESEINALVIKAKDNNILFNNETTDEDKTYIPINEQFILDLKGSDTTPGALKPINLNSSEDNLGSIANPYVFECFITRAATKFTFNATYEGLADLPEDETLSIKEIRVKSIGDKEYLLPSSTTYLPAKGEPSANTHKGRFITDYAIPDETVIRDIIFEPNIEFSSDNKNKQTYAPEIYFPETALAPENKFQVQILTTSKNDNIKWESEWVDLPNLNNLPRNTHVVVNITLNEFKINCTVDLLPYTGVELEPGFGIIPNN